MGYFRAWCQHYRDTEQDERPIGLEMQA